MEKGKAVSFYLGANTPDGFYSLYDHFVSAENGDFLWIIKGGPGCGKSSLMRRIGAAAQEAGLDVEYILCSGDPDSLDGIYIPEKHIAYADGTSPHILEPACCGASGAYLDLSRFVDSESIREALPELSDLNRRYKDQYRHAYEILQAVPSFMPERISGLLTAEDFAAVARRAAGTANRELRPKSGRIGKRIHRFLRAFSSTGISVCRDSVYALCRRIYLLDNALGLSDTYLQEIARVAQKNGYAHICCHDPMAPARLDAVLLPELSLGYISADVSPEWDNIISRHIRLDTFPEEKKVRANRQRLRTLGKLREQVLTQAQLSLTQAKALHDALEAQYNPHIDFQGVFAQAQKHIDLMLK